MDAANRDVVIDRQGHVTPAFSRVVAFFGVGATEGQAASHFQLYLPNGARMRPGVGIRSEAHFTTARGTANRM